MKDALCLLKAFCDAYFVRRDARGAAELFSEEIKWCGDRDARGLARALALMEEEISRAPSPYRVLYASEDCVPLSDGVSEGFLRATLMRERAALSLHMSGVAREEKLATLHMSISNAALSDAPPDAANAQAQLDNMINAIPGGVAKYRYQNGINKLLYHSDGVGALTGRTRDEYARLIAEGFNSSIYPDDLPTVLGALDKASKTDQTVSVSFRVPHKDAGCVWLTAGFRRTEIEEDGAIIHAVFTPLSFQNELFQMLVNESDTGIIVRDLYTYELLYTNKAACALFGVKQGDYLGKTCHDFFDLGDHPCAFCNAARYRKGVIATMPFYVPKLDKYFSVKGTIVDWAGREATVEYLDDVTALEKSHKRIDDLLQNVPCGICLASFDGRELTPIMANVQLSEILGRDAMEYLANAKGMDYSHVHPDDVEALMEAAQISLTVTHRLDHTYRSFNMKIREYLWIRVRGAVLEQMDGTWMVYLSYYDVTQEHRTEQKLRESERTLEYAADMAQLWYWTYDPTLDRAYLDARNQRDFDLPPVMDNFMEEFLKRDVIHPDYKEQYRDAYHRAISGESNVTIDVKYLNKEGAAHWGRFLLVSTLDEQTNRPIIVCTAIPIDAEKELEAKYELEHKKPSLGEKTLLVHALFNLTTGETLEYAYRDGTTVPLSGRTAFTGDKDFLDDLLIDEGEREKYRALNDKAYLMACCERGETEFSIDYRRLIPDGSIVWVRNILHLVRDPRSNDILLFEYCYDVEEEKTREIMYRSLALDNYDYVARINGRDRSYTVVQKTGARGLPPLDGKDADLVSMILAESIVQEDREEALKNMLVDGIKQNLADRERFQFAFRTVDEDGKLEYKKVIQYYMDRQREIIVMIREDVSARIEAEMKKNAMLADALEAANQASKAKSQFLSRMSHELRTPMNAIIGLSALAASETENAAVMEDTIGKIGLSARYLLSLINDILEMSRIESGRLYLNEGPFDFEEMISSVNNIIYAQASAKGLDYDAVVNSFTEPTYIGDVTKLQQILVNVLGNAIKFTNPGGKVTFAIEQVRRTGDRATLRFVVSDTGIGIDEDFLPHIFDPFSQQSTSFTSTSTGTGLGLAITKSMVEMMNGGIRVQSIKNVGSTFTIEVQLGISQDSRRQLDLLASMNLSKLRALIVDDDVVVCQSTEKTLSAMGITAEWVDSGLHAVERVEQCHLSRNDFDTIFIDWKMPDMDGIETTRRIRRIVGPDITIIIITAYDWKTIESEAREAGVDMFMEKPLFQSSIVNAFERIFCARRDKITVKPQTDYDFTGLRILLAEDHPLNVEVAKRLLEKCGAAVEVACNGLEALEMFTTAEPGRYGAILMDVRMPIMDGLTAARSIRNLKKAGAKTVPIIAMTANAFDEDVKQSLSNGMDAHLTKPIEPPILFSTLKRLVKKT